MKSVFLGIVACSCIFSMATAQKKLVIMGSSTSACTGPSSYGNCYVGRIYDFYNTQAPPDTFVVQKAAGGTNIYHAMPSSYTPPPDRVAQGYLPDTRVNITSALAENPDVIIVNFPSNAYNQLPIHEIMFCYRTIRDSAAVKNVPCFITTTQPRNDAGFDNAVVKRKMADIKDSIMEQFGARAVDFWNGLYNPADTTIRIEYNNGSANNDRIHLNDAAHAILFDRVRAKNIFGPFGALPATFLKNTVTYEKGKAVVRWITTNELNIASFQVQRSTDGVNFISLGALAPQNNPANQYNYQFDDGQPAKGINYYRVAIIDADGKIQYSPILRLVTGKGKLLISKLINLPNQLVLDVQSNETQTVEWQIVNNTGAVLSTSKRKMDAGNSSIPISTIQLSKGIYYLRLLSDKQEPVIMSFFKN